MSKLMQVTYDLGISKIAMPLKSAEKEVFKNLFIHTGTFHIWIALFKAIGKVIAGWGLTKIISEARLMGNGSDHSFLSGKNFALCKRVHSTVALALQLQELKMFVEKNNFEFSETIKQYFAQPKLDLNDENEHVNKLVSGNYLLWQKDVRISLKTLKVELNNYFIIF